MKHFPIHFAKAPGKAQNISRLYMRLKSRLTLYFTFLVLIPAIIVTLVTYFHTRSLIKQKSYEAAQSRITLESNFIGKCLEELELAVLTSVDSLDISDFKKTDPQFSTEASSKLSDMINDYLSPIQQKAVSAVYIIDSSGITASFGPDAAKASISDPSSQKWFNESISNGGSVVMLGTVQRFYAEGKNKVVLCIAKSLGSGSPSDKNAVMLFDFNYSLLSDFLKTPGEDIAPDLQRNENTERLIIDKDGNILYCRNERKLTAKADEALLAAVYSRSTDYERILYNKNYYYMTCVIYPEFNWTFIDLNPASNVTGRIWLRNPLLTISLAVFILILLVYLGISLKLMKPINDLTAVISDYENQFPGERGHTPLLQMQKADSDMSGTSDIDYLINKISRIKLSQKEAELNSLQNQINPHFLYNTLESIRGAALYHGIHEIASMSKSLSLLFRYSISERVLVSVKEELQHLENYISIQNFRFEDKFELKHSIPPELMNYKILKLTLQPLIENSIKHGLEMKLGKGTIKIELLSLDSNIKIIISDDGLGIPSKKLEELNRSLADEKSGNAGSDRSSTGIGVMNVNSRIKLYFGEQYGLRFREALAGTTVELTLPAVKES